MSLPPMERLRFRAASANLIDEAAFFLASSIGSLSKGISSCDRWSRKHNRSIPDCRFQQSVITRRRDDVKRRETRFAESYPSGNIAVFAGTGQAGIHHAWGKARRNRWRCPSSAPHITTADANGAPCPPLPPKANLPRSRATSAYPTTWVCHHLVSVRAGTKHTTTHARPDKASACPLATHLARALPYGGIHEHPAKPRKGRARRPRANSAF